MSETITEEGDLPAPPGRHRRSAGASTWTPLVRAGGGGGRHQAPEPTSPPDIPAQPTPLLARIIDPAGEYGYRPTLRPLADGFGRIPVGALGQAAPERFSGELSLDDVAAATLAEEHAWPAGSAAVEVEVEVEDQPTIKRTKVTLTPAVDRDDDVRVYIAPPPDGLSKFDLGTVPASVTPPPTWRKAAWFASVSSGGVVVALLVAGSYLVGQPTEQNVAIDGWPGLRGTQPEFHHEGFTAPTSDRTGRTTAARTSPPERISDLAGARPSGVSTAPAAPVPGSSTSPGGSGSPTGTRSASPTTTTERQKPPPSSAPRDTRTAEFYSFPPDAETMGDRSETFLNEITENPEKAWEQTGGDLRAEGPDGIAARYADIAYFEIEHIYIDQRKRMTVNTVKVYWKDGDVTSQQRTLRFEEGDKITSD
ncbi:MAG: hypothetical protein ACRDQ7_23795 [Haloechinothrix sp.]